MRKAGVGWRDDDRGEVSGQLDEAHAEHIGCVGDDRPVPGESVIVDEVDLMETIVRKRGVSIALGAIGGRCGRESACPRSS
jgi:hypothetical protein